MMKKSLCPICGKSAKKIYKKYDAHFQQSFNYYQCRSCAHIYLYEKLTEKELFQNYSYSVVKSSGLQSKLSHRLFHSELYKNMFTSKRFIKKILRLHKIKTKKSKAVYLDYGSGNGQNLKFFHELSPNSLCIGYEKIQICIYF